MIARIHVSDASSIVTLLLAATLSACTGASQPGVRSASSVASQSGPFATHQRILQARATAPISISVKLDALEPTNLLAPPHALLRQMLAQGLTACGVSADAIGGWASAYWDGTDGDGSVLFVVSLREGVSLHASTTEQCLLDPQRRRAAISLGQLSMPLAKSALSARPPAFDGEEVAHLQLDHALIRRIIDLGFSAADVDLAKVGLDAGTMRDVSGFQPFRAQMERNRQWVLGVKNLTLSLSANAHGLRLVGVIEPVPNSRLSQLIAAQDRRPPLDSASIPTQGSIDSFSYIVPTSISEEVTDLMSTFSLREVDDLTPESLTSGSTLLTRLPFTNLETRYLRDVLTTVVRSRTGLTTFSAGKSADGQPRARMFVSTSNSAAFLSAWLDASSVRAAREVQAGFTYEAELVSPLEQPTLDQFERSLGLAFAGDANGVSQRTVQRGGRNIQVYNASVQYGDLQPKPADVVLLAGKQGVTFVAGVHEALDVESALDQPTPRPERGRSWFMPERRPWFGARVRYDEVFGVRSQLLDTLSLLRRVAPEHLVLTELVKLDEAEQPNDDEAAGLEFWTLGWSERGSIAVEAQMTLEKAQ